MRLSFFIASVSVCLFAVGCSHKQKEMKQETTPAITQQEEIKKEEKSLDHSYVCDVQGDKRIVVLDKEPKRCEVHYTKFGESNQVAWAEATPSICGEVFERIRTNIESKGFKCQAGNSKLEANRETAAMTK